MSEAQKTSPPTAAEERDLERAVDPLFRGSGGHLDISPPDRLVMFSDGVFAIAMTLLALDLIPPTTEYVHGPDLRAMIFQNWQPVLSFAISFWVIGSYWVAHMRTFRWVSQCDTGLVRLNLLLLMLVCFLPYPTAVLGDHGAERPAVIFYAVSVGALGVVQTILWLHAMRGGKLIREDTPPELVDRAIFRSAAPALVFFASALIALVSPTLAMVTWFAIPLITESLHPVVADKIRRVTR